MTESSPSDPTAIPEEHFYWQPARDSLLTTVAIQLFQIAVKYNGEDFDTAKTKIDHDYAVLRGHTSERHGGKFQTAVQVYQEAGWLSLSEGKINVTDAGRQAVALLADAPDFLRAAPQFLVDLLSRFQLNNPERPTARNDEVATLRATSDVFPYWTIWKIMRACNNRVTTEELQRFVFRLHDSSKIDETVALIKAFRADKTSLDRAALDEKYAAPLTGANAEPKYWMARAGVHIGGSPAVVGKPDANTFELDEHYLPMIDRVLASAPVYQEHLSSESWMKDYGRAVPLDPGDSDGSAVAATEALLSDEDPLASEVLALLEAGSRSFLLTGAPGTSKSWYARQLAARIVDGNSSRVSVIQFHPSYAYEDFVEGFVPTVGEQGGLPTFIREWKIFAEVCDRARSGEYVVLVIDEFSRGDSGRIFGEALTYIEPEYRDTVFKLASGRTFSVPSSLVIIATMNPFDRSVSAVDVAMQRRFEILRMPPSPEILAKFLQTNGMDSQLAARVLTFFQECQEVMPHGGLGHAYFLHAADLTSLKRIWTYRLEPLFDQELQFTPALRQQIESAYVQMVAE